MHVQRRVADVRLQDVRELPADFDGRFDAVTLLGCMEHMTKSSWPRGRCQAAFRGVLANARVNIIEMITGLTDISVFIPQADIERAEALLQRVLQHYAK